MTGEDVRVSAGGRADHHLAPGYRYRTCVPAFDDAGNKDEWQDHVYAFARRTLDCHGCASVLDIGCGSGYKLVKYFGDVARIGVDRARTVALLRARYPDGRWLAVEELDDRYPQADLYICSDVIEHVPDPAAMLAMIAGSRFSRLVISTPAREILVADGRRDPVGPPANIFHVMEWTMGEFHRLLSDYFDIERHFFEYNGQYTQIASCRPKANAHEVAR